MKTILLSLLAAALSGLGFGQATSQPAPSVIERQPLDRWLGDWTFETTTRASPFGAGGTNVGACSVLPLLAGQGGEFRDMANGPQENLRRIEPDGFDPAHGGFFWSSFAGDAAVIDPAYTFDGPRVAMVGTLRARDKRYRLRSLVTFADDFQSFTDRREISADGVHWTLLSESRAAKVGAVLAAPDRDTPQSAPPGATSLRSSLPAGGRILASETKWTPAQQEIVAVIDAWAAAFESGNLDRIMHHTAPAFSCWEFAMPQWKTRAEYRQTEAAFYRTNRVTRCELPAALIEIDGDTAAVQGRHIIHVETASGAKRTLQGSWSAALIRRGGEWMFLNLAWIDDRPPPDEAAIKVEVGAALDAFKASVAKVDLAATLATAADVPEFRYTTDDGTVMGFAGWRQGHLEYFPTVTAHRFVTKNQAIMVLGPDAALVSWTGAMEITPKSSAVLRIDPFSASFVFKRLGGAWRLVAQHESCPPAKAGDPTASAEPQLRAADTELVAAANARDLERWLACFEDGARMFPPDGPPIAGKAAIRPAAEELMKSPAFAVVHRVDGVEVSPCGTLAWVEYAFELTTPGPDGQPTTETGRDTTLHRRGPDGRWRVVADFWRQIAPAGGD